MVADLEPGDAIYIPALWWHAVQATGELNVLVNYWWNEALRTLARHCTRSVTGC